ncbi:ABC transporter permease [Candidatus Njordibacter sp. Uisw_056]|jgi:NitT/TauT family transport system permease protein|uniref:ABC transporter permease n=1 Tax=Candidatus Njordibacter sp. Uisw_056 TaxID=3230973 RepID=UPI003D54C242|tara:strand:+ start:272 stop:1090 length:819 start_codon:yes stop_codon:yes gene_type:complete
MNINKLKSNFSMRAAFRGLIAIIIFIAIWEFGARSLDLIGYRVPFIGLIPPPTAVLDSWAGLVVDPSYWQSWYMSFMRVFTGFLVAMVVGIPLGLYMAVNRTFYGIAFPSFEILRPIPPLAWVPASIIFWPTQEMSIAFVTFLGAFYTIVINVLGGAKSINRQYLQAAQSMGASQADIFRRIILPATLPSIVVGSAVGMGITWEVVVAAEMISGGGSGGAGGGLGFFIWSSYVGGSYEQIIVGMISIGIAGYISSELLRKLGGRFTPWLKTR